MPASARHIIILDTTLRDGDQTPGFSLSTDEKLIMAGHLEKMGVDIIEAGFPASSSGQFSAVQRVAERLEKSAVSAMARAKTDDIKKAGEAIRNARQRYIHTSIATSPIHRKMKLRKSKSEIIKIAVEAVKCAALYADYVEIGAEDATRTEPEFLSEFCTMVTEAGADVVNIADTVGYVQPAEFFYLISRLYNEVDAFKNGKSRISVHCHNDLGLANANTLYGLSAGAVQAEVTLLGAGERGGNTSLEELAAVLMTRPDYYKRMRTSLQMEHFASSVRDLSVFTGMSIPPNKPIAGRNAFSHSSGIHQNGMLASRTTYSILNPGDFGFNSHRFILSRHSGVSGFNAKIKDLTGDRVRNTEKAGLLSDFNQLADAKKAVTVSEVLNILFKKEIIRSDVWVLDRYIYSRLKDNKYSVSVFLSSINGGSKKTVSSGNNKWETILSALLSLFIIKLNVIHYSFSGAGKNSGSAESFFITAEYEGAVYSDETYGNDTMELFIKSYLNIINQILSKYQLTGV